jgi:adenylosuccinate synthase
VPRTDLLEESALPRQARDYIDFLEQEIGARVSLVDPTGRRL